MKSIKNVLLIGGPGTGKTTVAKELMNLIPNADYYYGSRYGVRIPMTLARTTIPGILSLSRKEYLATILKYKDIETIICTRKEMDEFGEQLFSTYGQTILAEVTHTIRNKKKTTIIDNAAKVKNMEFHKKKGVFIVGLTCSLETQVKRRKDEARDIDLKGEAALREDILRSMNYFELEGTLKLADVIYNTEEKSPQEIAKDVLHKIQQSLSNQ